MFKHSMIGGFTSLIFSSLLHIWTGLQSSLYIYFSLSIARILKNPILNRCRPHLIHKCIINLVILHHVTSDIYMQLLLLDSVLARTITARPIFTDDCVHCTAITGTIQCCGQTCSKTMSLYTLAVAVLAIA